MNGFYNILHGYLWTAYIGLFLVFITIWLGKTPIRRPLHKTIISIIITFIIALLFAYTQPAGTLPYGMDNDLMSDKASWNNEGLAYYNECLNQTGANRTSKLNNAIECYNTAIKMDQNYVLAWSNKGRALEALNKNSDAKEAFAKARESQDP
jgi:tetratricopeptide (TPR) repeat protein